MNKDNFYLCCKYNDKKKNTPILFFHVPKCAGTTVSILISWLIKSQTRISGPLFKNNDKGGKTAFQKFNSVPNYEFYNQFNFIYGHIPYEVLKFLKQTFLKVTLLRDPVKRAYSHYNWMISRGYCNSSDNIEDLFKNEKISENTITNQFSGHGYKYKNTEKSLSAAYENLSKNIDMVYDSDNIFELLKILISTYNLPNLLFQNQQETFYAKNKNEKEIISIIKKRNSLDIQLYNELKIKNIFKGKNNNKKIITDSDFLFSSPHLKVQNKNHIVLKKKMLEDLKQELIKNNFKVITK